MLWCCPFVFSFLGGVNVIFLYYYYFSFVYFCFTVRYLARALSFFPFCSLFISCHLPWPPKNWKSLAGTNFGEHRQRVIPPKSTDRHITVITEAGWVVVYISDIRIRRRVSSRSSCSKIFKTLHSSLRIFRYEHFLYSTISFLFSFFSFFIFYFFFFLFSFKLRELLSRNQRETPWRLRASRRIKKFVILTKFFPLSVFFV